MKKAILLVSFGTSYPDARERSLECIYRDLSEVDRQIPVYQAYTSGVIIEKLSQRGVKIPTVEEAVSLALADGIDSLYVIASHMIPGYEYQKMVQMLEQYRMELKELRIATPILNEAEDCKKLVPILCDMLKIQSGQEYILMGHGTEDAANIRYEQMNQAIMDAGYENVRIASVEARPDLEDAVKIIQKRTNVDRVILHPFMVVAGDHANNDMAGCEDSYVTRFHELGYQTEAIIKGLGEYPQFRKIYVDKLIQLMK